MLSLMVYIVVVALIAGLLYWVVDVIPVPQPINRVVKVIIIVFAVIAIIYALLGLVDGAPRLNLRD